MEKIILNNIEKNHYRKIFPSLNLELELWILFKIKKIKK